MGERLTAEREAFVRECVADIDVRDVDEADRIIVELLAEIDAVRAERDAARLVLSVLRDVLRCKPGEDVSDVAEAAIARAERAEAGLAALRERCRSHMTSAELADTAAAAEAYRARVRAEALREAAGTFDRFVAENQVLGRIDVADAWMFAAQRLRARADEIEGGL